LREALGLPAEADEDKNAVQEQDITITEENIIPRNSIIHNQIQSTRRKDKAVYVVVSRADGYLCQTKHNIHQKLIIIDNRIVRYGSINLLSFGSSEENIMRLDTRELAAELETMVR
jgi:phosphatidylserine/phosphatidylglycerophosphate/cardiolipin synthase-like enzyme